MKNDPLQADILTVLNEPPPSSLKVHKVIGWGTRTILPTKKLEKSVYNLHTMSFDSLILWCLRNVETIKRASPESESDLAAFRLRGASPWRVFRDQAGTFPFKRGLVLASHYRQDDPIDRIEEQAFSNAARNRWTHLSSLPCSPPRSVVALSMLIDVPPEKLRPVIVVWWAPPTSPPTSK